MLNIIRADVYRILRSKGLYITFGVMVCVNIINIMFNSCSIGPNIDKLPTFLMSIGTTVIYYALPMLMMTATDVFVCGAAKNDIVTGTSRVKLFFSKWILSSIFCLLIFIVYLGSGILIFAVLRGVNGWSAQVFSSLIKPAAAQTFMLLAFNGVGLFFTFLTRSSGATIGAYIAFSMVPYVALSLASLSNPGIGWMLQYEPYTVMQGFAQINSMAPADITKGIATGAVLLTASVAGAIAVFRKAEIK